MLGDSMRRRRKDRKKERGRAKRSRRPAMGWVRWLGWAVIIAGIAFGAGYVVAAVMLFPAPSTGGAGVPVPALVGETREQAEQALTEAGLSVDEIVEMPHDEVRDGVVLAQQPLAGQMLRRGGGVRLAVSAGRPQATVPAVHGLGAAEATALLERIGFEVTRKDTIVDRGMDAMVLRVDPEPGTEQLLPAAVELTVAVRPPEPALNELAPGVRERLDSIRRARRPAPDTSRARRPAPDTIPRERDR